jgi:hypothetical protein
MYIVKNVCKSLLHHILGEKDTDASRADLVASNTKKSRWTPQPNSKGKMLYQVAPSTLQKKKTQGIFLDTLKSIKTLVQPCTTHSTKKIIF